MSNYNPIYRSIWNDTRFTEYTPEQQLIFIYLITNHSCRVSGIYKTSVKEISFSTNIDRNLVLDTLKSFDKEVIEYDATSSTVFIKNFFKYNMHTIGNPKVMISSLLKNNDLFPHCDFWSNFLVKYENELFALASKTKDFKPKLNNSTLSQGLAKTYLTLNQGLANPYVEVEVEVEVEVDTKPLVIKEVKEVKKVKEKIIIPDFIEVDLWNDFVKHRIAIKAKLTDRSTKLIIKDLVKFEGKIKGNANVALENTLKSGKWTGVFDPSDSKQQSSPGNKYAPTHKEIKVSKDDEDAYAYTRKLHEFAKSQRLKPDELTQDHINNFKQNYA